MKSQIHEFQKNKLLRVSKNLMMLALMVLGTSAMVNAQTTPEKTTPAKEVKMGKHKKDHKKDHKKEGKEEMKKEEAPKMEATKPKK